RPARQTPPGARPNRVTMTRPAESPGRLLERIGDDAPRGMTVHDRTRLIGRLRHQNTEVPEATQPAGCAASLRGASRTARTLLPRLPGRRDGAAPGSTIRSQRAAVDVARPWPRCSS